MENQMAKYKLFISHKHADAAIALVVANFVREKSLGQIEIHLSSDPKYRGPGLGGSLNEQLKEALWNSDALILIYTGADKDWSYCMWECGVATHPQTPHCNIYVLQCGSDVPSPFAQDVRANARSLDDIRRFTDTLLRGLKFFPRQEEPLASGFETSDVFKAAEQLYADLQPVLPQLGAEAVEEWLGGPRLIISLPITEARKIEQVGADVRTATAADVLQAGGTVRDINTQAAQVFGRGSVESGTLLSELMAAWSENSRGDAQIWLVALAEQASAGLARKITLPIGTPISSVSTGRSLTPFLSSIRRTPAEGRVDFEIYLLDLGDPRVVPITDRMIPIDDAFYISIDNVSPAEVNLKKLRDELTKFARSRVPILGQECRPLYIVHRSMIDQFMLDIVLSAGLGKKPDELTLADLLNDKRYELIFKNTFVVIPKTATVADALQAMHDRDPNCRDAFVTENGRAEAPVLGWLTTKRLL